MLPHPPHHYFPPPYIPPYCRRPFYTQYRQTIVFFKKKRFTDGYSLHSFFRGFYSCLGYSSCCFPFPFIHLLYYSNMYKKGSIAKNDDDTSLRHAIEV